ncbi:MAG TPA: rRNA maturation RNase YbeY [Ferruginibacter sp.]|nr:rRNA maturation RNase YbeY [Ferruginibacter sp.]
MQKIHFYFHDRNYNIRDRRRIKQTVEYLFVQEGKILEKLDYVFCSDKYLLEMNRSFLKHDYFTDIITFDLSETESRVVGEIYISLDRVIENAKGLNVSIREELCRVIFHGALHLCGYKDKKRNEVILIRKKEDEYLRYCLK